MKKKEKQSLRSMSPLELTKHVSALETEITKGMLDGKTKQVKNVRLYREKRKEVAIGKTILKEKAL